MINMFEMMQQGQNGDALRNLSKQFGLSEQQTHAAVDALMPAFNEAMRRNVQSMEDMQRFWGDMHKRNMQPFYDSADAMRRDDVWMQGNDVLGGLFGSKDVSRAVAQQAAMMSGLGPNIIQQMLPVVAAMMMGGLMRQGAANNPMEDFFRQMMGQATGTGSGMSGLPGPLGAMVDSMMGNRPMTTPQLNPMTDNPMGAFIDGMLKRLNERSDEAPDDYPASDETPEPGGADTAKSGTQGQSGAFDPGEVIDALFDMGRKTQTANSEAMGRIFEQFMGSTRR